MSHPWLLYQRRSHLEDHKDVASQVTVSGKRVAPNPLHASAKVAFDCVECLVAVGAAGQFAVKSK